MKRLSALFAALLVISALAACRTNKETDRISQSSVPVKSTVSDTSSDSLTAAGAASEASLEQTESAESSEPPKPEIVHVDGIKLSAYERTLTVGDRFMPIVTMSPVNASNKAEKWESSNTAVATVNNYGNITAKSAGSCVVTVTSVDNPDIKAEFKVTVNEPVKVEMTYMDGILIVNKTYPLPQNYNPGVNPEAKAALDKMFAAAKAEQNLKMWVCSGFRSYTVQKNLYNSYVRRDGAKAAGPGIPPAPDIPSIRQVLRLISIMPTTDSKTQQKQNGLPPTLISTDLFCATPRVRSLLPDICTSRGITDMSESKAPKKYLTAA